jgi:hypothetical protein
LFRETFFDNHFSRRVGLHGAGIAGGNQHSMHARSTFSNADNKPSESHPLGSETEQQHADGSVKLRMCG